MNLVCPKCGGAMRGYERNGVHVDQCEACRGIFLDMGELEAIIRATTPEPGAPGTPSSPQPGYQQPPPGYGQPGMPPPQQYPPQAYPPGHYAPGWGTPHRRKGGIASLFFSS